MPKTEIFVYSFKTLVRSFFVIPYNITYKHMPKVHDPFKPIICLKKGKQSYLTTTVLNIWDEWNFSHVIWVDTLSRLYLRPQCPFLELYGIQYITDNSLLSDWLQSVIASCHHSFYMLAEERNHITIKHTNFVKLRSFMQDATKCNCTPSNSHVRHTSSYT